MDRESRKNLKKIQKEMERLKEVYKKLELRPCHTDAELEKKDKELRMLKNEIYKLEREVNQLASLFPK